MAFASGSQVSADRRRTPATHGSLGGATRTTLFVPRPTKRVLLNVFTLFVGLCVSILAAEAFVLVAVGEQVKFPRRVVEAPWGLQYNEPGAQYRHKSRDGTWYFRINSQGMRADRDYRHEKPPGVRRILVVGDSFTVGYEVDVEQTLAMVLERELRHRNLTVDVLNAGV